MYGVVLWSNPSENKAVIWCEDHGDLAFYRGNDAGAHVAFDAGDLIQFEISQETSLRYAHNARLVGERMYDGLADKLGHNPSAPKAVCAYDRRCSAEIIPFSVELSSANTDCGTGSKRASQK